MTVLVAYAPASEGREALSEGIKEAHLRKSDLLIVNIGRGHHDLEPEEVRGLETRLAEAGLGLTIESSVLSDPGMLSSRSPRTATST
nr:hypothetical protein GCM10017547_14870 [Pseudarthrobacter oxydans]